MYFSRVQAEDDIYGGTTDEEQEETTKQGCHQWNRSLSSFTFAHDFRPLRANRRFKLKFASPTLISFKHFFFIRIIDKWNNLPMEIAEAENFNTFKNRKLSPLSFARNNLLIYVTVQL